MRFDRVAIQLGPLSYVRLGVCSILRIGRLQRLRVGRSLIWGTVP